MMEAAVTMLPAFGKTCRETEVKAGVDYSLKGSGGLSFSKHEMSM